MVHTDKYLTQFVPKVLLRSPDLFRDVLINSVLPTVACHELRRDLLSIMEAVVDSDNKIRRVIHGKKQ
jgi:hypothetical protein